MTKASLIFNPNAGRARSHAITSETLSGQLLDRGIEVTDIHVDDMQGIPDFVESVEPGSLLIAGGGDGTMYEVVQVAACRQLDIGLVPLGTSNNLAVSAGIPMDIDAAVDVAASGRVRIVDLGVVDGRVFTEAAGVGFHAEVFRLYGEHQTRNLLRAGEALLKTLAKWEPQEMRVTVDGVSHSVSAVQVTVANTPLYGNSYPIAPNASLDDGLLDVAEIRGCKTRLELVACVTEFMEGREPEMSNTTRMRGRRIEIAPLNDARVPAHADSEPIGYAPVTIEVLPACLRLRVPA